LPVDVIKLTHAARSRRAQQSVLKLRVDPARRRLLVDPHHQRRDCHGSTAHNPTGKQSLEAKSQRSDTRGPAANALATTVKKSADCECDCYRRSGSDGPMD
jgi:hypothetical protein